jgi:hypothetical protein
MTHRVTLLWFSECPGHEPARAMVTDVVGRVAPDATIEDVDASRVEVAVALRFPGSPTIRVDGVDIEPGFEDPGDYTPRCRLYRTQAGLGGQPDPRWLEEALRA